MLTLNFQPERAGVVAKRSETRSFFARAERAFKPVSKVSDYFSSSHRQQMRVTVSNSFWKPVTTSSIEFQVCAVLFSFFALNKWAALP